MAYRNYAGAWLADSNQAGVRYVKGSWADETLFGSGAADEFEGGGGRDTLVGGAGDDYYWVRDTLDVVREDPGAGVDTVRIWSSYSLPANVENLIVFGDRSYAKGNDQANIVQGLDGSQFLYGGRGEDVLAGGGGADTFVVVKGEGNKVIEDFQSWSDKVRLIGGGLTTFDAVKGAMTQQGSDVVLNDGGTMILFRNASIGQFTARDFQLPLDYQALGRPTFADEFNGLQTGSVWKTNFGYAGDGLNSFTLPRNGEMQIYVAPEFKGTTGAPLGLSPYGVRDGLLTITAQPSGAQAGNMWGYQYTSGMLDSHYAQTYGYFEIRADLPLGKGLWPAFWLLGEGNSEIDILEALGSDPTVPYNAIHSNMVPAEGVHNFMPSTEGFHTYGALWSRTDIVFYVDGTEVWRTATPADISGPMHMIVNLAVGGNWAGAPDGSTPWPAEMKVDYVRAYGLPGSSPQLPPPPPPAPPPPPEPAPNAGVSLVSKGFGDVMIGTSGADTLTAGNGGEQMTGGAGADLFVFRTAPWSPSEIVGFQSGVDHLDLSALLKGYVGTDPVADRWLFLFDDGAGGTKVCVDPDGTAAGNPWPQYVAHLQGAPAAGLTAAILLGNGAAPSPVPAPGPAGAPGVSLTSTYPGDRLTGGAGADTITASRGSDIITGGDGADRFVFPDVPWSPADITDFRDGDVLDLRGVFAKTAYWGSDPVADRYLGFIGDGAGGTKVLFDSDGAAAGQQWPSYILHLPGVAPESMTAADWIIR